jgi:hypothetical protein
VIKDLNAINDMMLMSRPTTMHLKDYEWDNLM